MMMNTTEADYENWRDDLRCGGQDEYATQYSAASLYEGGWRASDLPDLIEQYNLTSEDAQQEVASLLVENRKQADSLQALSEAVAQKQKNIDGRDEQIANLNSIIKMQADRIKELEEGVESSASRVMALENENVHLKARLYDILMK